jgi:acyl-CoA thioesterase I
MKKRLTLLFFCFLLTYGMASAGTETSPLVGDPNYTLYFPLIIRDCPDPVILAVGDSITQGVGTSSGGPGTAFPRLLELKLEETYHRNFTAINAGMGGARTFNVTQVIGSLIDTYQPDLVLLMIGTNDFGDDAPDWWIYLNIRDAITIALNKGVRVIVASNPPVDPVFRQLQFDNIYDFVVTQQQYYLFSTSFHIPLAEVFSAFYFHTPGWTNLLPDHLHPNDAGHAIIRDVFYDQITPLLDQGGCFR